MMKYKMHKGYTILEAVIALTVLTIAVSVSLNIITSSVDSENLNRDLVIAAQLAEEGVEEMINVYQSNIVKFGAANSVNCGLMMPSFNSSADLCLASSNKFTAGNYFIGLKGTSWTYVKIDKEFIVSNALNPKFKLYLFDSGGSKIYGANLSGATATDFYRVVSISDITEVSATITSKVGWVRQGGFITTREVSHVINF